MILPSQFDLFAAALATTSPRPPAVIERPPPQNYRLDGERPLAGSWGERAHDNIAAIELMQQLLRENRNATREEQDKLIRYIGFGATALAASLFPVGGAPARKGWERLHD